MGSHQDCENGGSGNAVSEHAERNLSLIAIGRLLALTSSGKLNVLAAKHYKMECGANNIYTLRTHLAENPIDEDRSFFKHGGQHLFQETATHEALAKLLAGGAEIKTTRLTDKFSLEDYLSQPQESSVPLFSIDPSNRIHPWISDPEFSPNADWKIIDLSIHQPLDS